MYSHFIESSGKQNENAGTMFKKDKSDNGNSRVYSQSILTNLNGILKLLES